MDDLKALKSIDVLIVVDVAGALASNNLSNNVYLVDTNKYMGSWSQGQCELVTVCQDSQVVKWRVVSIDPGNNVEITGFTGQIISEKVCVPEKQGKYDVYWEGMVQTRGTVRRYQYSVVLSMNGKKMEFDPYLDVRK